jgi:3-deoxy-D-manno-octulosonate 8-phosphate phosphatase (KDO 8-P phosphatase)
LLERAASVRLLLTDVDGVLTDGGLYYLDGGGEAKRFDVRDGLGLVRAREAGIATGIVSGRPSEAAGRRARELGMDEIHLDVRDKPAVIEDILTRRRLPASAVCFVGDDLNDLDVLRRVGFPAAPADAAPEVRRTAILVTRRPGGSGAVREIIDFILEARARHPGRVEGGSP